MSGQPPNNPFQQISPLVVPVVQNAVEASAIKMKLDRCIFEVTREPAVAPILGLLTMVQHEISSHKNFVKNFPGVHLACNNGFTIVWEDEAIRDAKPNDIRWSLLMIMGQIMLGHPYGMKDVFTQEYDFANILSAMEAVQWVESLGFPYSSEPSKRHRTVYPSEAPDLPVWAKGKGAIEMFIDKFPEYKNDREAFLKMMEAFRKMFPGVMNAPKNADLANAKGQITQMDRALQEARKRVDGSYGKETVGAAVKWSLGNATVDWRITLRNVFSSSLQRIVTGVRRNRYNRRLEQVGIIAHPPKFSSVRRVLMFIDVSGSNEENIGTCVANVLKIARTFSLTDIDVVYVECAVAGFQRIPIAVALSNPTGGFKIVGSGGTDMRAGFTWFTEAKNELTETMPDLVLIATDGETPFPTREESVKTFTCPIVWLMVGRTSWTRKYFGEPKAGIVIETNS